MDDDTLLIILNGHHENAVFVLPAVGAKTRWRLEIDTGQPDLRPDEQPTTAAGAHYDVLDRTLLVWRLESDRASRVVAP
jgi:hypothetical protein